MMSPNINVLLADDDNADMREHLSSILSGDFNVITAYNGMDALHKMKETTPTVVLADVMMPVMDGFGLLKEIKGNKATANIPVIFLTALNTIVDEVKEEFKEAIEEKMRSFRQLNFLR